MYIADHVETWSQPAIHAEYNGLLVKRPLGGDEYHLAIDEAAYRIGHGITSGTIKITRNLSAELKTAISVLLASAALPARLNEQIQCDACAIGGALGDMCGTSFELDVKLEIVGDNVCSRWHMDNFVGRALVSYSGVSGTLYSRDANVNFWEMANCGNNDHIIRDLNEVESVEVGDMLFMKGKQYGGGKALVHKAPEKRYRADGRVINRLMLKVDVNHSAADNDGAGGSPVVCPSD